MKRTSLLFTHKEHNEHDPAMTFLFPEPNLGDKVIRSRGGNGDKGWQYQTLGAIGIGRHLSYRHYNI